MKLSGTGWAATRRLCPAWVPMLCRMWRQPLMVHVQCFPVHCSMSTGPGAVSLVNLHSIDEIALVNLYFCLGRVLAMFLG